MGVCYPHKADSESSHAEAPTPSPPPPTSWLSPHRPLARHRPLPSPPPASPEPHVLTLQVLSASHWPRGVHLERTSWRQTLTMGLGGLAGLPANGVRNRTAGNGKAWKLGPGWCWWEAEGGPLLFPKCLSVPSGDLNLRGVRSQGKSKKLPGDAGPRRKRRRKRPGVWLFLKLPVLSISRHTSNLTSKLLVTRPPPPSPEPCTWEAASSAGFWCHL